MENAFQERVKILENILPDIFRFTEIPPNNLLKRISIHLAIGDAPHKVATAKHIRPSIQALMEKYIQPVDIVQNEENLVCPLTQGIIKKRWVGDCGHVFDESTILNYMARRKTTFCPIHGCDKKLRKKQ